MTAVCNATGLIAAKRWLGFPASDAFRTCRCCKPKAEGGTLEKAGVTEVTSSAIATAATCRIISRSARMWCSRARTDYARRCFKEYAMLPDPKRQIRSTLPADPYDRLELGISGRELRLASRATGVPTGFRSDVVATAKRDLKAGEMLERAGAVSASGQQMPAGVSLAKELLPLGLAHNVKLKRGIAAGAVLNGPMLLRSNDSAVKFRREMESAFGRGIRGRSGVITRTTK